LKEFFAFISFEYGCSKTNKKFFNRIYGKEMRQKPFGKLNSQKGE
jgi:hypothetical protein